MKPLMLAVTFFLLTVAPGRTASWVEVHPLMEPFFRLYDETEAQRRLAGMKAMMADEPALYGPIIPNISDEQLTRYIGDQERNLAVQRLISTEIEVQLPKTFTAFERTLGRLKPTSIYIAPSLFTSNGQVRMAAGKPVVVFGPDVQAYVVEKIASQTEPYDVRALVAHEFFHSQHYASNVHIASQANALFVSAGKPPLYINLWIEGLATCASMIFDGDAKVSDALMSEELARELPTMLPRATSIFKDKMVSTSSDDYRDFFWLNGQSADLPKRSGYGLGAVVADRVIRKIGLRGAMKLHGDALRIAISTALDDITAEPTGFAWSSICQ